jgi:hypothetical protein
MKHKWTLHDLFHIAAMVFVVSVPLWFHFDMERDTREYANSKHSVSKTLDCGCKSHLARQALLDNYCGCSYR